MPLPWLWFQDNFKSICCSCYERLKQEGGQNDAVCHFFCWWILLIYTKKFWLSADVFIHCIWRENPKRLAGTCCLTGLAEAVVRKITRRVIFRSSICDWHQMEGKTHKVRFSIKKSEKHHETQKKQHCPTTQSGWCLIWGWKIEEFTNIHIRKESQTGWNQPDIKRNLTTFKIST